MPAEGRERAVTVVIGAVLMFGLLVSALALYQANVVPTENEQTEWDHQNDVEAELVDVRNAIQNANGGSDARTMSVTLGTSYEPRTFAINPPPAAGRLSAVEADSPITIDGVGALDEIDGANPTSLQTSSLRYEPGYYEYESAPVTTIEHSLVYNEFADGNVTIADQRLFSRNSVSLIALDGEWSKHGRAAESIDVTQLDGQIQRTIRDRSDLNVTIPTQNPAHWAKTLRDNGVDEYADITVGSSSVSVDYNDNETDPITLSISRVGVGSDGESTGQLDGISDGTGQYDLIWNKTDVQMDTSDDTEHFEVTVTDSRTGAPVASTPIDIYASHTGGLTVTAANRTSEDGSVDVTVKTDGADTGTASLYAAVGTSSVQSSLSIGDGDEAPPSGPSLDVQPVTISDTDSETQFPVDVTVEEMNGVETEGLSAGLTVEAPNGTIVYDESMPVADITGETTSVTFGEDGGTSQLGPFEAGSPYTATVTADADNAAPVEVSDTFAVQVADSPVDFDVSDVSTDSTTQTITFNSDAIGNKDEVTIDLSSAQGTIIDYTGATVSVTSGQNVEYVTYDPSTDEIRLSPQGNSGGPLTIEVTDIDVVGDAGQSASIGYSDTLGTSDTDTVTIEQGIPSFESLEATANVDGQLWIWPYTNSVTVDYTIDAPGSVSGVTTTIYDSSGSPIGSRQQASPASPFTVSLDSSQLESVDVEIVLESPAGDRCLQGTVDVGGTITRSDFNQCS
ncbi:hypothetical protein Halru_1685 [Halovivax ruber XH-70]|uniref:Big-1 domain-containing protein n=1 Tax=Halovivax ruber (strain DSM 18193 / JCM 13892 / XH-70) TaxID=797302 RepID=L0IDL3_HALRX|nr:hypothetical protein [Halovivax ruber]AGB16291.1 hypothetical protein Halru_1685 [Halovivax ruber XH-70]